MGILPGRNARHSGPDVPCLNGKINLHKEEEIYEY